MGETLALAELEETLGVIAERLPDLELVDGAPAVEGSGGIRRVGEMPPARVTVDKGASGGVACRRRKKATDRIR